MTKSVEAEVLCECGETQRWKESKGRYYCYECEHWFVSRVTEEEMFYGVLVFLGVVGVILWYVSSR